MAAVVRMPALAAGATEAAIQSWLVGVGDTVAQGQAIVEIETEKAVVEYEAEQAGVLAGILVSDGSAAAVGAPIAVLAESGETAEAALAAAGAEGASSAASTSEPDAVPATPEPAPATESSEDGLLAAPEPVVEAGKRLFASPLVRKLAGERSIDLSKVTGSGPNGRIVRRDLDGVETAPAAAAPAPAASAPAPVTSASAPADGTYEDVPHTGMRRAIARRLTESKSTVPHFYLVAECRVDELLALRERINAGGGVKISVNDFVVKAVAAALRDVPEANAIWTDEATRRFTQADIAVAVSVPAGLLTPVVRGVDRLSLSELSAQIKDLAGRARDGKLKQHELEGGSFSVSNLGMYGTQEFSAILNPPQSGILAVGAASQRPVVTDGELGVATVMTVTLSADHRVLDGALAAQWLAAFQAKVENPLTILI
jgi:pyruvate dehydrogenase E2 component (dihydrolipoamide acetyltransferase)